MVFLQRRPRKGWFAITEVSSPFVLSLKVSCMFSSWEREVELNR